MAAYLLDGFVLLALLQCGLAGHHGHRDHHDSHHDPHQDPTQDPHQDPHECSSHHNPNASLCSESNRHHTSFIGLDMKLRDAQQQDHIPYNIVNITLGMYQYLHPCQDSQAAVLDLFHILTAPTPVAVIARKRRHDEHEHDHDRDQTALLHEQLDHLLHETGDDAGCVQLLINKYQAAAASAYRRLTVSPTTSTTTTTATTTQRPTTTPKPITAPPSPRPTPLQTAANCTTCSQLECLLHPRAHPCPAGHSFCMTAIDDYNGERQVFRRCASQAACDALTLMPQCAYVHDTIFSSPIRCEYCCLGNDCNRPPQLMPDFATLYIKR